MTVKELIKSLSNLEDKELRIETGLPSITQESTYHYEPVFEIDLEDKKTHFLIKLKTSW